MGTESKGRERRMKVKKRWKGTGEGRREEIGEVKGGIVCLGRGGD